MSVDTKSSLLDKKPSAGSNRNLHQHSSSTLSESNNITSSNGMSNPNDIEQLKHELEREKKNRSHIQCEYADLKRQMEEFGVAMEEARNNPTSKYDAHISKQDYFNDTLAKQIGESKEKLKEMSLSLKHIQSCGKECNIHMRDLIVDYNCISKDHHTNHHHHNHHHLHSHANHSDHQLHHRHPHGPHRHPHHHPVKGAAALTTSTVDVAGPSGSDANNKCLVPCAHDDDVEHEHSHDPRGVMDDDDDGTTNDLSKEIRRFQRMQIDLKSNLDRLQWRLDCESKIYHSVNDQYQKLQMDLCYLKNLNEKGYSRDMWMT